MPATILIIGAQGALGSVFTRCFEQQGWTVLRAGRRPEDRPDFRLVDLDRPRTVREAISGVDLVVDLVPHPGLVPERTVLRHGGIVIDVSARPVSQGRALHAEISTPRGLVVLNAGRTPGISNLVAAELLSAHPEADEIELALSLSAFGMHGRAGGEFTHRHLTARRRHRTAVLPLPPPIGPTRCLRFADADRGWLANLANGRTVSPYARHTPAALNAALLTLNALRLMAALPRSPFLRGSEHPRLEPTIEPVTEWVAIRTQEKRLASCTIEGRGGYLMTANATAVLADALIGSSTLPGPGCREPQELFTLRQLEPKLSRAGIHIIRHPTTCVGAPQPAKPTASGAPQKVSAVTAARRV